MSAQHHETVDTRWVSFREEQERNRLADAMRLVAFLKAPADVNRWREKRSAHVEEDNTIPYEVWRQRRLAALPAPQQTGAIRPVSAPLPSASPYASESVRPVRHIERAQLERTALHEGEDEMPAWARRPEPEHLDVVPSRPLAPQDDAAWLNSVARVQVRAEPERQSTGALDALAILAAQKPNEDTKEVPSVMRKRHTKESE